MTNTEEVLGGKIDAVSTAMGRGFLKIEARLTKLETTIAIKEKSRVNLAVWVSSISTLAAVVVSVVVLVNPGARTRTASIDPPAKSRHFTNGSLAEAFCDIEPDP